MSPRSKKKTTTADAFSEPPARPDRMAVELLLSRAFRQVPRPRTTLRTGSVAIIVEVPDASFLAPVGSVLRAWLGSPHSWEDGDTLGSGDRGRRWPLVLFARDGTERRHTPKHGNDAVAIALASGSTVVGVAPTPERTLPADLLHAADHRICLSPIDGRVVTAVIQKVTGHRPASRPASELCRKLTLNDLCLAIRPGSTANDIMFRLGQVVARRATASTAEGPRLADLHGLAQARAWGEALARDMDAYRRREIGWDSVDRGVLLAGPPGTGKTMFASALARSCGCPLVSGSLGEWQAAGHLGDLLKAMRGAFAEARRQAPCVMFIDEIDSFGDRRSFSHDNRDYSIQVVNAFLEELNGTESREGVVVVGATNDPNRLDQAIRRSGRLDRTVWLQLPDPSAMYGIFRYHLGPELESADLTNVVWAALGGSGADVERWVRGARRKAREAKRPLEVADLLSELGTGAPDLPDDQLRRAAVHEAGHALAGSVGGAGTVTHVSILPGGESGGRTLLERSNSGAFTQSDCRAQLMFVVAGRAAEEVLLGEVSSGCGGGEDSDLAVATELAIAMESSWGLGPERRLLWFGPPGRDQAQRLLETDGDLVARVSATLDEVYGSAVSFLDQHREPLQRVAEALLERRCLRGDDLRALIEECGPRQRRPGKAARAHPGGIGGR